MHEFGSGVVTVPGQMYFGSAVNQLVGSAGLTVVVKGIKVDVTWTVIVVSA